MTIRGTSAARWTWPIGLILALTMGLLAPSPAMAAPAAPGKLAPKSTTVAAIPVLKWSRVRGAVSYNVQVSTSSSFSSMLYSTGTTNRQATPTAQLPTGRIYWRVQAVNSSYSAGRWATASFTRGRPAGPGLVSPSSGSLLKQPENPPLLKWNAVKGAISYQVEIDGPEHDWVETSTYSTGTTSLVVPNPQHNGTYWWRVRAQLGDGLVTLPSSARSYKVGPLPVVGAAIPATAADGSAVTTLEEVVFDWDPVPGAISYDIRVSTDDSFNQIVDSAVVKGTRYSPPNTYDNTNYWWQVRARDIFGQAQEWDDKDVKVREFRRAWAPKPELVYPADEAKVGDDFYFQWKPVRLASMYRLDIGYDPNFSPNTILDTCYTTQTTYTPRSNQTRCMPAAGRTTYWRVQPLDDNRRVNGIISDVHGLIYDPGAVTQLSPTNGQTVDVPTLRWEPAKDSVKYLVRILSNGNVVQTAYTHSYAWTPHSQLAKGSYTWTVQAVDQHGAMSPLPLYSDGASFTVSGNTPTSGVTPLTPLSPTSSSSATARFPELRWEPYPSATRYRVMIARGSSNFVTDLGEDYAYPAATDPDPTYLQPGTYRWYVEAYDGGKLIGHGDGLPWGSFTISDLGRVSGQKIALEGSGLASTSTSCANALAASEADAQICTETRATPVLDWDPTPNAGYYLIYLSYDREFTNLVYGNKADANSLPWTTNTRWTPPTALKESQAGGAYYWFIRPCKATGACAPDPTSATHAFQKKSNEVERLSPVNGATVANDVTFDWTDYLATNQKAGKENPRTKEKISQSARAYHIQVGTTSAFSTLVDDMTVDQTTYTPFSLTYPEGTLYWRVQAIDGSGNGLAWSPAWKFVKKSPRVSLESPGDGSTVSGTQPFRWKPLNFAGSYDIEVYKNGDTSASSANLILSANSQQTAYSPTQLLPVSSRSYVWRVRRADADGRRGAWSAWRSFKVTGRAPSLVSPRSDSRMSGKDALFTWKASSAAAYYLFELRQGTSGSNYISIATSSTAYAPTSVLPRGRWKWRVTTYNGSYQPIKSSAWRGFRAY